MLNGTTFSLRYLVPLVILSIYKDIQMINFQNIRFQTLRSLYSLLFIFIVKLKQFEIPPSVEVSSI